MPIQPEQQELRKLYSYTLSIADFDSKVPVSDGTGTLNGYPVTYYSSDYCYACLQDRGTDYLLMFAGSHNIPDYLLDLLAFPAPATMDGIPGEVHSGFLDAWGFLQCRTLQLLGYPNAAKPITIIGHSLGSAIGTLCSGYLVNQGYKVEKAYLLGSPRVGDIVFATWAASAFSSLRVVNNYDVVPTVPCQRLMGYHHIGDAMYIRSGKVATSLAYRYNPVPYVYRGITDHFLPESYLPQVQACPE